MSNTDESPAPPVDEQNEPSRGRLRSNSYDKAVTDVQPAVNNSTVKNPSPEPQIKPPENEQTDNNIYIIKWIEFNYDRLPILLQNVNGPCPLLAIANILLLRKKVFVFFFRH
jgi:hypothetical protein